CRRKLFLSSRSSTPRAKPTTPCARNGTKLNHGGTEARRSETAPQARSISFSVSPCPRGSNPLHPLGHLFEHHFGGAAADGLDAGVAIHALDGALAHE